MAYTYLIGWSQHKKFYYGVRYAYGCDPNDLWVTYFTSSKYVQGFRKIYGEPDIIQVRKIFNSSEDAILWESTVLKRMNVVSREDFFLNRTDNRAFSLETCKMPKTESHKEALSKSIKRKIEQFGSPRKGSKHTNETREKIRQKALTRTIHGRSRHVVVLGQPYSSVGNAATLLNKHRTTITKWLKNENMKGCYYAS